MLAVVVLLYLGLSGRFGPTGKPAPVPSAPLVGENAAATSASPTDANPAVGDPAPGTARLDNPERVNEFASATPPRTPVAAGPADNAASATPAPVSGATDEWFAKADRLAGQADWSGLVTHSQQWSVAEPQRDLPWVFLGIANGRLQNNAQAIDAFNQALKINPINLNARWGLSDVYLQTRQWREAADLLNALVQSQPDNAKLQNNLGNAMLELGEYDESVGALEKAVKLDPGFRDAWNNLGNAYKRFGYPDRAAAAYAKANGTP
jgi:cytochrome c-type biogenesis protein CcmH/NrfG